VSSERYKRDIHEMGNSTEALMKLRPVTFTYKSDRDGTKQYGLVAEEVEPIYPELVVHDDNRQGRVGALFDAHVDASERTAEANSRE